MSWFKRLMAGIAHRASKYAGIPLRDPALVQMLGNQPTAAGVDVDPDTAMNYSAVWQATNIVASNVAAAPPVPMRMGSEGPKEASEHWSHHLLLCDINSEMTPFTFYETLQAHALTWGNGYAEIVREGRDGPVVALEPLMPNQITPERNEVTGEVQYRFVACFPGERDRIYKPHEVLHIAGLGFDGLKGYNVIEQARESIGLGAAVEKYGAAFFGRGSSPGGILQLPEGLELSEKAKKNLRESFELMHRGPDNAHRIAVLEDGVEYRTIGLPLDTAQFLQTRQFQIVEIARWFNVPPHLLRDLTNATFSNIEHQGIDFLVYTLTPWLIRWKQEIRRKLYSKEERRSMMVEHDVSYLLMTDITNRYNAYRTGREGGWLKLNDILRMEKMPRVRGSFGESRIIPENMKAVNDDGLSVEQAGATAGAASDSGQVADTAMNGIQVSAMKELLVSAASGEMHPDTVEALLKAAFPAVPDSAIQAMLKPIREGKVDVPKNGGEAGKAEGAV